MDFTSFASQLAPAPSATPALTPIRVQHPDRTAPEVAKGIRAELERALLFRTYGVLWRDDWMTYGPSEFHFLPRSDQEDSNRLVMGQIAQIQARHTDEQLRSLLLAAPPMPLRQALEQLTEQLLTSIEPLTLPEGIQRWKDALDAMEAKTPKHPEHSAYWLSTPKGLRFIRRSIAWALGRHRVTNNWDSEYVDWCHWMSATNWLFSNADLLAAIETDEELSARAADLCQKVTTTALASFLAFIETWQPEPLPIAPAAPKALDPWIAPAPALISVPLARTSP